MNLKALFSGIAAACAAAIPVFAQESTPWCYPDTIIKVATSGNGGMQLFTFDDRGNALVTEYIVTDKDGNQTPMQKITAAYNRFDLVDTTVNYVWRSGGYRASERKIASYDARGNHVFLLNENYSEILGCWVPRNRYTYTYNEQNLKVGTLVEEPSTNRPDEWVNSEKADYTYDAKGRELTYEQYTWAGSAWAHYRSTFNRYENDRLVQELGMGLSSEGVFDSTYRLSYTYDAAGKSTEWLYEAFLEGMWENSDLRHFYYDENGHDTMLVNYQWNLYQNEQWDSTVKEVYKNRPDGQRIRVDHYTIEGADLGKWFLSAMMEYEYNGAGRRTAYNYSTYNSDYHGDYRYEFELNENNDDVRATCFVKKDEAWEPTDRINLEVQYHDGTSILYANEPMHEIRVHYRKGTKLPVPDDAANEGEMGAPAFLVRVYPNPAREILSVEVGQDGIFDITLFDFAGRKMESRRGVRQYADFDVSRYQGVYLLRVENNGAVVTRKIVVL